MTDSLHPLFSIFAFFGFLLPLIPLPWHLEGLNSGTCFFIFWSSLACLNQFVNSIVWFGNAENVAPAWCEISIRIMMASSVGIPASSLCISRRLYKIIHMKSGSISLAEKHRTIIVDALICFLFPLLYIPLQYVVQGHRFDIFEDIGCYPALYNTLLTFFISNMWPIVLGLISAVYCGLTLRTFTVRRAQFFLLISSNTSITLSRYFRLMALAMTEIIATMPLSTFVIWLNATAAPLGPWRSWDDTHFDYSRVRLIPAVLWRSHKLLAIAIEFSRWMPIVCSFVFFCFFGFASETRKYYGNAFSRVSSIFGFNEDEKHYLPPPTPKSPQPKFLSTLFQMPSFPRPLKTRPRVTEAACDVKSTISSTSHISRSTITLDTFSPATLLSSKKAREAAAAAADHLPPYNNALDSRLSPTAFSDAVTLIGRSIDDEKWLPSSLANCPHDHLPQIDDSDAFTVSSFSYYESPSRAPSTAFLSPPPLVPATPPPRVPLPPSPAPLAISPNFPPVFEVGLPPPPPPRRQPRAVGSLSSFFSNTSNPFSNSVIVTYEEGLSVPDVPEDV